MGAAWALDVDLTSETVDSRPIARRTTRLPTLPFDTSDVELVDDTVDTVLASDFEDDYTDPDPLSPFAPAWAPADIGQRLIDEWDASADARAARPAKVAAILRASADDTAITSAEKRAVRSAS